MIIVFQDTAVHIQRHSLHSFEARGEVASVSLQSLKKVPSDACVQSPALLDDDQIVSLRPKLRLHHLRPESVGMKKKP